MNMSNYNEDVRDAEVIRSLDIVINSWENDDLSIEDMTAQLEAVNKIADGSSDFAGFLTDTQLHGREVLN